MKIRNFLSDCVAMFFFSGKSKFAPGTAGSLATLPLVYLVYPYGVKGIVLSAIICYILGIIATKDVLKRTGKQDPGFVVIDETVGQILSFVFVATIAQFSWINLLLGFLLFRLFDIVKIWPCSYFDKKVHNAFGVMTDDVIAGLYAAIFLFFINFYL